MKKFYNEYDFIMNRILFYDKINIYKIYTY